jgi:hypothetical protein
MILYGLRVQRHTLRVYIKFYYYRHTRIVRYELPRLYIIRFTYAIWKGTYVPLLCTVVCTVLHMLNNCTHTTI